MKQWGRHGFPCHNLPSTLWYIRPFITAHQRSVETCNTSKSWKHHVCYFFEVKNQQLAILDMTPVSIKTKSPYFTICPSNPSLGAVIPHLGREFRGRLLRLGTELRGLLKPRGWLVGSFRKSQVKEELGIETFISWGVLHKSFTTTCHICWFFDAFHDFLN